MDTIEHLKYYNYDIFLYKNFINFFFLIIKLFIFNYFSIFNKGEMIFFFFSKIVLNSFKSKIEIVASDPPDSKLFFFF